MNIHAWALRYAARGFHVIPLHEPLFDHPQGYLCTCEYYRHSDRCKQRGGFYLEPGQHCESAGKHPRLPNWEDAATTEPARINGWWCEWPTANLGIAAGKSGIVMLDADKYKNNYAGDKLLTRADEETVTVLSGRGAHLWYRLPEGRCWTNAKGTLPEGIDIRGHGGQFVAPPSMHMNGRRYQFELGYSLGEINIADCPTWLADMLDAAAAKHVRFTSAAKWDGTPTTDPPDLLQWPLSSEIRVLIAQPAAKGERSQADMRVCVQLVYAGATDDNIRAVFEHNPIGKNGKFAERGLDYLERTVLHARTFVDQLAAEREAKFAGAQTHPSWHKLLEWAKQDAEQRPYSTAVRLAHRLHASQAPLDLAKRTVNQIFPNGERIVAHVYR